jgi:hypothetical protein
VFRRKRRWGRVTIRVQRGNLLGAGDGEDVRLVGVAAAMGTRRSEKLRQTGVEARPGEGRRKLAAWELASVHVGEAQSPIDRTRRKCSGRKKRG